ncbi:TPA: hypothetical protein ACPZVA_004714, partial [Escherichia coli]|nr:hypothetical protein [Escherichia coli]
MVKIAHGRERLMILLMSAGLVLLVMVLMMIQMLYRGLISRANIAAHNECLPLKFIPGHIYQVKK